MKKCCKCKLEKSENEFYKNPRAKDNLSYSCKTCFIKLVRKRTDYLNSIKEKKIKKTDNPNYQIEYRLRNKERLSLKKKVYYTDNKKELLFKNKEYYENNKKSVNKKNHIREKEKRKNCDLLNLKKRISDLIRNSIKRRGYSKKSKTCKILGCEHNFFLNYIESQFRKGMDWNNIHLDHIKPISTAKTEKEVLELNHYTNFQPLFAIDNLSKSNKLIDKQLKLL